MCVVSIKEFNSNPNKYFQIARTENVLIEDGNQTYELTKKEVFITGEELKSSVISHIHKLYKGKEQVISQEDIENGISGRELITAVCERIDKFADK